MGELLLGASPDRRTTMHAVAPMRAAARRGGVRSFRIMSADRVPGVASTNTAPTHSKQPLGEEAASGAARLAAAVRKQKRDAARSREEAVALMSNNAAAASAAPPGSPPPPTPGPGVCVNMAKPRRKKRALTYRFAVLETVAEPCRHPESSQGPDEARVEAGAVRNPLLPDQPRQQVQRPRLLLRVVAVGRAVRQRLPEPACVRDVTLALLAGQASASTKSTVTAYWTRR